MLDKYQTKKNKKRTKAHFIEHLSVLLLTYTRKSHPFKTKTCHFFGDTEIIPFATQKKIFKRLADIADSRCLSKEEMEKYEESQRVVDNYNLGMYSAWYQGNEEGIKKGKIDTQIATAKNFLAMKLTPDQVAAGTGLSLEEVLALMKKQ